MGPSKSPYAEPLADPQAEPLAEPRADGGGNKPPARDEVGPRGISKRAETLGDRADGMPYGDFTDPEGARLGETGSARPAEGILRAIGLFYTCT